MRRYDELVEGLDQASSFDGAGVVFYFSWYFVGCLILANAFSAFIIDAFLSQFTNQDTIDEEIHSLDQSLAGENYRIVATRGSNTDDVYKAMFLEES